MSKKNNELYDIDDLKVTLAAFLEQVLENRDMISEDFDEIDCIMEKTVFCIGVAESFLEVNIHRLGEARAAAENLIGGVDFTENLNDIDLGEGGWDVIKPFEC